MLIQYDRPKPIQPFTTADTAAVATVRTCSCDINYISLLFLAGDIWDVRTRSFALLIISPCGDTLALDHENGFHEMDQGLGFFFLPSAVQKFDSRSRVTNVRLLTNGGSFYAR